MLYLFEKDKNRRGACYGLCPLTDGKPVARAGAKTVAARDHPKCKRQG
jgi:hypothetical protein